MQIEHEREFEVIVIGAGVAGIYQIKRLADLGVKATVLEAAADLGGTWYNNRYPGARFDSESYTYGYSFSPELLDEWHWKERFSGQPENLPLPEPRRRQVRPAPVHAVQLPGRGGALRRRQDSRWRLRLEDGRTFTCRFVVMALGLLSARHPAPLRRRWTRSRGQSFHTFYWPHEPVDMAGKKVAVIGTGATGIQVIGEIADKVGELTVFQRRPNWAAPAQQLARSSEEAEMADIRARYDEIFETCARTPGGFEHETRPPRFLRSDPRGAGRALGSALRRARLWHLAPELPGDLHGRRRRTRRSLGRTSPSGSASGSTIPSSPRS